METIAEEAAGGVESHESCGRAQERSAVESWPESHERSVESWRAMRGQWRAMRAGGVESRRAMRAGGVEELLVQLLVLCGHITR